VTNRRAVIGVGSEMPFAIAKAASIIVVALSVILYLAWVALEIVRDVSENRAVEPPASSWLTNQPVERSSSEQSSVHLFD
jgi:hypothetical protein